MKGKIIIIAVCVVALSASQAGASVFSASGSSSLQSVFNGLGYSQVNAADYQTELNVNLQGMMEFKLLSKSMSDLSFGVMEKNTGRWGTSYTKRTIFGDRARSGSSFAFDLSTANGGFFISKPNPRSWWRRDYYYSDSSMNQGGAVQALFYRDPLNSNSYLLAWEGMYVGSSHSDKSYSDMVVRMTVHPAPEPTTWVLLASGLVLLGVFAHSRQKQDELS